MTEPSAPSPGRRAAWIAGALLSLAVAAALIFALVVVDEETRAPGSFGGGIAAGGLPIVVIVGLSTFGGCLGRALVPRSVAERGRTPAFTAGSGLLALGIVFVIPSQLFCITLPLGVLALALAAALLYSTRR